MNTHNWRRTATGLLATALVTAGSMFGAGPAHADVLDDLQQQYDIGASGGEISTLVHSVVKMRAQGYRPSKGNMADIQAAIDKRPNEMPLIKALKATIAFQTRTQSRANATPQSPIVVGGTPGGLPPGIMPNTGGSNISMGG